MVGLRRSQSDSKTVRTLPALLSPPLTRFIGREGELEAAARLLRGPARLVTLTGPGGIGKTRLAHELARSLRDEYADGAAFVSLAPIRSAALVMPAIAETLAVRVGAAYSAHERVFSVLRGLDILLILDNLEQIADAAPALSELLLACPRLTMLVTSRAPLRISGERLFAVPPLALPQSEHLGKMLPGSLEALAAVEAVALFVDRAQAALDFALTAENAATIAAICERTDGVPLAIELAAARASVLSLPDLRDRLAHQLTILRDGPRDQPPRLRSMADAIAWSYNLLAPAERALLRRLSVFVGGVSLDAAEWVSGVGCRVTGRNPSAVVPDTQHPSPVTLDLLTALVDQSLLQRAAGPGGATRFAMLETVREFGLARLAETREEAAVRDAHADWCIALAEQADPALSGPEQAVWFDRLDAEHPNMRAALAWLLEREDAVRGLRLATALSWFWSSRGYLREALAWLEKFLAVPVAIPADERAMGLREAANIAQWQGEYDRAAGFAMESLTLFRQLGDRQRTGHAWRGLGSIAIDQGRMDEAAAFLTRSWETLEPIATPWDAAFATYLWGRHASAGERYAEAAERFSEAAATFAQVGDRAYVAASLGRLGAASLRLGDLPRARAAYAESLRIAREMHEPIWIAWALLGATHLAAGDGRPETGARLLGAALAIRETTGEVVRRDDLEPTVRAALMSERYASARARGASLPRDQMLAQAFAVLEPAAKSRVPSSGPQALTARERDVLRLLIDGLSDKEIAAKLGISRYTASNHVTAIRDKLGAPSRTAVVAIAIRDDLV